MALALISTALWGSAYPAIKIGYELFHIAADDSFSKILFAGYRFALAGILVIIFTSIMEPVSYTHLLENRQSTTGSAAPWIIRVFPG